MAKLILSEKEKKSANYLEWSDEALGKAVKKLALDIRDRRGEDSLAQTACATLLACAAAVRGEQTTVMTLEGVTDGEIENGNWQIVISRLATESKVIGRIPRQR